MSVPDEKDNDLADLLPDREVKLSTGETVTVRPLHFVQLEKGAIHIRHVIGAALRSGVLTETGDINLSELLGLVAAAGGHVNALVQMCTYREDGRVTEEWMETVSLDDGLELTKAVILANWRESVAKKLESLNEEVQALLAGAISSNGLSGMDTDGPTSSSTPSARSSDS